MIRLASREQVLQNKLLADYVATLQAHQINDELEFAFSKKKKNEIRNVYDVADQYKEGSTDNLKEVVLYHLEDDLFIYPTLLSNALCCFFQNNNVDSFFVLPHLKLSLVSTEDNGISHLRNAQQLFFKATNNRSYNEAYAVNSKSFNEVIQALFWMIRYDATIPQFIFICSKDTNYFMSICKYGNLHFYVVEEEKLKMLSELHNAGLQEWRGQEFDRLSNSSTIEGRFTTSEE